jgi:hypothetical protein
MTNLLDTKPWYQQFWPWAIMSLPAIAVVAGTITIVIAFKTDDGLVSDDYYKEGLAINQSFARDQRATELGLAADILINPDSQLVEVRISNLPADETLSLNAVHSTIAGRDQANIVLKHVTKGIYRGELNRLSAGKWRIEVVSKDRGWRLSGNMDAGSLSLHLGGKN